MSSLSPHLQGLLGHLGVREAFFSNRAEATGKAPHSHPCLPSPSLLLQLWVLLSCHSSARPGEDPPKVRGLGAWSDALGWQKARHTGSLRSEMSTGAWEANGGSGQASASSPCRRRGAVPGLQEPGEGTDPDTQRVLDPALGGCRGQEAQQGRGESSQEGSWGKVRRV